MRKLFPLSQLFCLCLIMHTHVQRPSLFLFIMLHAVCAWQYGIILGNESDLARIPRGLVAVNISRSVHRPNQGLQKNDRLIGSLLIDVYKGQRLLPVMKLLIDSLAIRLIGCVLALSESVNFLYFAWSLSLFGTDPSYRKYPAPPMIDRPRRAIISFCTRYFFPAQSSLRNPILYV